MSNVELTDLESVVEQLMARFERERLERFALQKRLGVVEQELKELTTKQLKTRGSIEVLIKQLEDELFNLGTT